MTKSDLLEKYNFIFWDFDGVILDSMSVRDIGFKIVLKNYPKKDVDNLLEYHRRNGGLSRYHKFQYFFEQILKEPFSQEQIADLATQFSLIMKKELINKDLLINETLSFIKESYGLIRHVIVSGSDQNELRFLCKELSINSYFDEIYGSPTPKIKLVASIINKNKLALETSCLVGDSKNDLEAARLNKISFIGFNFTGNEEVTKMTFDK